MRTPWSQWLQEHPRTHGHRVALAPTPFLGRTRALGLPQHPGEHGPQQHQPSLPRRAPAQTPHALASAITTTMAMSSHVLMEGLVRRVARLNGRSRQAASASWSSGGRTSDGLMPVPEVTTVHSPLSVFRKTCSLSSTLVPAGMFPGCAST